MPISLDARYITLQRYDGICIGHMEQMALTISLRTTVHREMRVALYPYYESQDRQNFQKAFQEDDAPLAVCGSEDVPYFLVLSGSLTA